MLNAKENPKTLIDTINIDVYTLDVWDSIFDNIINNIKEYIVENKILKDISISKDADEIEISNKKEKDYCHYFITKEEKKDSISVSIYQDESTKNNKKDIKDEKEYYTNLFTVIWKSIDNVKDEIESEIKHEKMKKKKDTKSLDVDGTNFKSDISIDKIYEYLMDKFDNKIKGTESFNSLSISIEKLFKVEYKSIDDLVKIVYELYLDYGKSGSNVYYSFIYVFEELKRKNYVLDNLFSSNSIEKNIYELKSYVESDKYVKEVIHKLNDDFMNGMYDNYPNIKGRSDFILFITDIIHAFHEMYCVMYGIKVREEVRDLDEAVKCIIKNHTNVTLEDYKKIKKWADNIISDKETTYNFQQDLLSNLGTLYVKKHKDNEWIIDKTVLALVVRYDEMMVKYGYDEKIFPTYSILNCSKSCKDINEYVSNTKSELDKIEDLDYTDTMIEMIKSVTVIYHYLFMYMYGLDKLVTEDSIKIEEVINTKKVNNKEDKPTIEKIIYDEDELIITDDLGLSDDDDDFDLIGDIEVTEKNISKVVDNMEDDLDDIIDDLEEEKEIEKEEEVEEKVEEKELDITTKYDYDDEDDDIYYSDGFLLEYDVVEEKEKYIMDIILPGVKKSDIEIDYEYNKIIITTSDVSNSKSRITDKYYGKKLVYNIVNVDEDGIDASLKNGILSIVIPKKSIIKKKITIK